MRLTFVGGKFPMRLTMDLSLGWAFGIVFQYSTIVPMRRLSFGKGLFQAIRADTLAIIAFEIGLFAWMTFAHYVLFARPHLQRTEAAFWFMMQIGMIVGFFTSLAPFRRSTVSSASRQRCLPDFMVQSLSASTESHVGT